MIRRGRAYDVRGSSPPDKHPYRWPDRDEDREEDDRGIGVGVEDIRDAEEAPDIDLSEDHLRQVGRHSLTLAVDAAYQDVEQVASVGNEEGGVRDTLVSDLVSRPEEIDCSRSVEDAAQGGRGGESTRGSTTPQVPRKAKRPKTIM